MKRRSGLLAGGAGVVAAAAGVGLWRWQHRAVSAGGDEQTAFLWDLTFERPAGPPLRLVQHRGRPLVLNFWATWCPPCIEELPDLDRFQTAFGARGWQVVALAVDGIAPVREFLSSRRLGMAFGIAGLAGAELSRRLGNSAGGLPFTAVVTADGRIARRHLGQTRFDDLARWANGI